MKPRESTLQLLGLPDQFGAVLLVLSLILFLAPYLSGHDFGVLKIPDFSDRIRKKLKLIGPISLVLAVGLHFKFYQPISPGPHQPSHQRPAELIPDWTSIGGSWTGPGKNGMVHGKTAAFDGDALYLFKNTYTDFWFSAAVQVLNREASLAVRMSDDGKNGYLVILVPRGSKGGNPGLWLARRAGGNHTFPAFFKADHDLRKWIQLTVHAHGPRIRVFLNKDLVIDFKDEDSYFTSGRLGFRCYGEPAAPCEADFAQFSLSH